jgi:hypothetical protein
MCDSDGALPPFADWRSRSERRCGSWPRSGDIVIFCCFGKGLEISQVLQRFLSTRAQLTIFERLDPPHAWVKASPLHGPPRPVPAVISLNHNSRIAPILLLSHTRALAFLGLSSCEPRSLDLRRSRILLASDLGEDLWRWESERVGEGLITVVVLRRRRCRWCCVHHEGSIGLKGLGLVLGRSLLRSTAARVLACFCACSTLLLCLPPSNHIPLLVGFDVARRSSVRPWGLAGLASLRFRVP